MNEKELQLYKYLNSLISYPFTRDSRNKILEKFSDILKQLEAYENMRKEAIEFLKEYHNYENRFKWCEQDYIDTIEELENILNKVGDSNE